MGKRDQENGSNQASHVRRIKYTLKKQIMEEGDAFLEKTRR